MEANISEKEFPITTLWLFKHAFPVIIGFVIFLSYASFFGLFTADGKESVSIMFVFVFSFVIGIQFLLFYLRRKYFSFLIADHFMMINQGIFKKENRNTPYGRIQGVYLNQGLFERIFGLASLTIEDFSEGGISKMDIKGYVGMGRNRYEVIGFVGCRIHIPGLKKEHAEKLRDILLQKVKDHPINDMHSGL